MASLGVKICVILYVFVLVSMSINGEENMRAPVPPSTGSPCSNIPGGKGHCEDMYVPGGGGGSVHHAPPPPYTPGAAVDL
ncbi:hypothetical protein ABFX02_14G023500 [Erythranthe guttata]